MSPVLIRINSFSCNRNLGGAQPLLPAKVGWNKFSSHLASSVSQIKREISSPSLFPSLFPLPSTSLSFRSRPGQSRLALVPTNLFTTKPFTSLTFASISPHFAPRAASSAALGQVPSSSRFRLVVFVQRRNYAKSRKKMPPKKKVVEEKIPLGRPGNSLKSGIVCYPSIDNRHTMLIAC